MPTENTGIEIAEAQETTAAAEAVAATETPAETEATTDGLPSDPDQLKQMIRDLRKENGKARTDAKAKAADEARNQLVQDLGKALGLVTDTPTVEDVTAKAQEAEASARQAQTELAVYKAANGLADADALLDSRAFLATLNDLDPTDTAAVKAAVEAFVNDHPRFKPAQAAGASTVDHAAGSGEGAITKEQFKAMNGAERNELFQTNPTLYAELRG